MVGGEGGIRTLDTLPYTHFPGVLLQPLGHLSKYFLTIRSLSRLPVMYGTAHLGVLVIRPLRGLTPSGPPSLTLRRSFGCASSQPLGHLSKYCNYSRSIQTSSNTWHGALLRARYSSAARPLRGRRRLRFDVLSAAPQVGWPRAALDKGCIHRHRTRKVKPSTTVIQLLCI